MQYICLLFYQIRIINEALVDTQWSLYGDNNIHIGTCDGILFSEVNKRPVRVNHLAPASTHELTDTEYNISEGRWPFVNSDFTLHLMDVLSKKVRNNRSFCSFYHIWTYIEHDSCNKIKP